MRVPSTKKTGGKLNPTSLQQKKLEAKLQESLSAQQVSQAVMNTGVSSERVDQQREVAANNPISTVLAGPPPQLSNGGSGVATDPLWARILVLPSQKRNLDQNDLGIRQDEKRLKPSDGQLTGSDDWGNLPLKDSEEKPKIDQQKVKFKDKLYDVVMMFFKMADMTSEFLTEEMKNENQKLIKSIGIITGKNDREIGKISIDYMVSAFNEFQQCYTNVKEHLQAKGQETSDAKTIDTIISEMSQHDIIKYQEIKQNFQSEVEEYKSLGITLPDQEVEEINRYEYTSGANLTAFKTLVDDKIKKLKDQYVEKIQEIKQDFQSIVEEYKSLGITLPDQEVEEINRYEDTLGTNLERFETVVKNAINKLKVKYVEKMKVNLAQDVEGYLETISLMDQLKAILKNAQTLAIEETIENLKNFQKYIEDRRMSGKLTARTERFQPITGGLPEIGDKFSELKPGDLGHL